DDAPADLRAVGDAQTVVTRWIALVVAWEPIGRIGGTSVAVRIVVANVEVTCTFRLTSHDQHGPGREPSKQSGVVRIRGEIHTLRQHGDPRTFQCAHQAWLL